MRYLLDANTYIQAKNSYYDMQFCPAYWDWLDQQFAAGELASVEFVYQEISTGNDSLAAWVKLRKNQFLSVADHDTQSKFADVSNYVSSLPNKKVGEAAFFLGGADPWLIAKASVMGATVVTSETKVANDSKKIKIPNICDHFTVQNINSFELLRILQAQFVLAP